MNRLPRNPRPSRVFRLFFPDDLWTELVEQTKNAISTLRSNQKLALTRHSTLSIVTQKNLEKVFYVRIFMANGQITSIDSAFENVCIVFHLNLFSNWLASAMVPSQVYI